MANDFLNTVDFGKIPVANLVLEQNATMDTEGQISYNTSTQRLQYRNASSTITIDPTGGGGGSLPSTTLVDESANSTHTIDFQALKYYTGCTGNISFDVSSPVSYPVTQIIEHTSSNPLNILPSDDYVIYGIGDLDYEDDGSTKNVILAYFVDGYTDSNGKQVIRISSAQEPAIPTASNVLISGSAAGAPFTGSFTLDSGSESESNTINQIVKSTTGSDPFTIVSATNTYTPQVSEDGDFLKYRVKPAIVVGNTIQYADRFYESNYQQISGSLTTLPFESENFYSAANSSEGTNIDPLHPKTPSGSYVLMSGTNDISGFVLTGIGASSARIEIDGRTGTSVSSTRYVSPTMEYVITVNGTEYSVTQGNAFEFDSVTGTTATNDFGTGNGHTGTIFRNNVPVTATTTILIRCNITFGAIDTIKIIY